MLTDGGKVFLFPPTLPQVRVLVSEVTEVRGEGSLLAGGHAHPSGSPDTSHREQGLYLPDCQGQ